MDKTLCWLHKSGAIGGNIVGKFWNFSGIRGEQACAV
jgi:hypothetical protein